MGLGYQDTPIIPGTKWHVHDGERPQPRVVTPGNLSELPAVTPPSDAVVLFDGTQATAANWTHVTDDRPLEWELADGHMQVVPGSGNIHTTQTFGDMQLHVEWAAPTAIKGEGQGRGNSGVFLVGKYEIQVLDCYDNPTYPDGTAASVYGEFPPLVNACCKPGQWHVYDIIWQAPQFDGDKLTRPAYVTVIHNGVVVHNHIELIGPTGHRDVYDYQPHGDGPVELQDHGDLVRFRNIWVRKLQGYDAG